MRVTLVAAALAAASLALASPAAPVTGGAPDAAHSAVGLLLADFGAGPVPVCSTVLVARDVVLTAGHCTARISGPAWVEIDGERVAGRVVTDPQFGHDRGNLHDLGVVLLDSPVATAPAQLAPLGADDALRAGDPVSVVGYGYYARVTGGGPATFLYDGVRRMATSTLRAVTPTLVRISTQNGGACFGDSGGPMLVGNVVVGVTSGGDSACAGMADAYRVDTADARAFLAQYVS